MNYYVGHHSQIRGAEEHILVGGKGNGMRLLTVRNGKGLDLTISVDRCMDVPRISYKGVNVGYFAPSGYVAPSYYNGDFLNSFTAGFFTTCGLTTVGGPSEDQGEFCPMHGTISNIPAESFSIEETDEGITISGKIRDAALFRRKLTLNRKYFISYKENIIKMEDEIVNEGTEESPLMLLYHCNIGYPLLSENSKVVIPANSVIPRNEIAAKGLKDALKMTKPQHGIEEECFFYDVKDKDSYAKVGIYSPSENIGLTLGFDKRQLSKFTEWKMMGEIEYALGLEPGICFPEERKVLRERGELKFLKPSESYKTSLSFEFFNSIEAFDEELLK